jgi:hypothetical protein
MQLTGIYSNAGIIGNFLRKMMGIYIPIVHGFTDLLLGPFVSCANDEN